MHGGKSVHPTCKPLDLMKWLTATYSREGDLVLDPFMGSGATGEAALALGRRFLGVERDEVFFKTAQDRLELDVGE